MCAAATGKFVCHDRGVCLLHGESCSDKPVSFAQSWGLILYKLPSTDFGTLPDLCACDETIVTEASLPRR